MIDNLFKKDIEEIQKKTDIKEIKRAFEFFEAEKITNDLLIQILKLNFAKNKCISMNDEKTLEQNQILINTLEKNAEFYQQELVEYLRQYGVLFTGYTGTYCSGLSDQYDSGVGIYPEGRYSCSCGRNYGFGCRCGGGSIGYGNYF